MKVMRLIFVFTLAHSGFALKCYYCRTNQPGICPDTPGYECRPAEPGWKNYCNYVELEDENGELHISATCSSVLENSDPQLQSCTPENAYVNYRCGVCYTDFCNDPRPRVEASGTLIMLYTNFLYLFPIIFII